MYYEDGDVLEVSISYKVFIIFVFMAQQERICRTVKEMLSFDP